MKLLPIFLLFVSTFLSYKSFSQEYEIKIYSRTVIINDSSFTLQDTLSFRIGYNERKDIVLYKNADLAVVAQYHLTRPSRHLVLKERMMVATPDSKPKKGHLDFEDVLVHGVWEDHHLSYKWTNSKRHGFAVRALPKYDSHIPNLTIDFTRKAL